MRAGLLRHRITLQRATVTPNALGEMVETWGDVGEYWGDVRAEKSGEGQIVEQTSTRTTHTLTLRGRISVLPGDRISWSSRTFHVASGAVDDPKFRQQTFALVEVV